MTSNVFKVEILAHQIDSRPVFKMRGRGGTIIANLKSTRFFIINEPRSEEDARYFGRSSPMALNFLQGQSVGGARGHVDIGLK